MTFPLSGALSSGQMIVMFNLLNVNYTFLNKSAEHYWMHVRQPPRSMKRPDWEHLRYG